MTNSPKDSTKKLSLRIVVLSAVLCSAMLIPASGALASAKSIRQALKVYIPKIEQAEGHVQTAIGEYKEKGDPAVVEEALGNTVTVVQALEAKVAKQSARSRRVKRTKAKIIAGLEAIVLAYQHLGTAFADKAPAPSAAKAEAEKSIRSVRRGYVIWTKA